MTDLLLSRLLASQMLLQRQDAGHDECQMYAPDAAVVRGGEKDIGVFGVP
jgi:hypothetical protein